MPASYEQRMRKRGVEKAIQYREIFRLQPGETPNRWDKRVAAAKVRAREMLSSGHAPAQVIAYFQGEEYAQEVEAGIIANMSHFAAQRIMARYRHETIDQYRAFLRARRELSSERKRERMKELAERRRARELLRRARKKKVLARLKEKRDKDRRREAERRAKLREKRAELRRKQRARRAEIRRKRAYARAANRILRARSAMERRHLRQRERAMKLRIEAHARRMALREAKRRVRDLERRMKLWLYAQRDVVIETIKANEYAREMEAGRLADQRKLSKEEARQLIIDRLRAGVPPPSPRVY